jgi:hypothetical protein
MRVEIDNPHHKVRTSLIHAAEDQLDLAGGQLSAAETEQWRG